MADVIEARVKQKKDTLANWEANPMIILDGEQAFVVGSTGQPINFKIGDGTKRFSDLPYWIDYAGGQYIELSGNALPTPSVDVGYTFVGPGTYTFAGQPDIVAPDGRFSQLVWDGTSWSLKDMGELPSTPVSDVIDENGEIAQTQKGVFSAIDKRYLNKAKSYPYVNQPSSLSLNNIKLNRIILDVKIDEITHSQLYEFTVTLISRNSSVNNWGNAISIRVLNKSDLSQYTSQSFRSTDTSLDADTLYQLSKISIGGLQTISLKSDSLAKTFHITIDSDEISDGDLIDAQYSDLNNKMYFAGSVYNKVPILSATNLALKTEVTPLSAWQASADKFMINKGKDYPMINYPTLSSLSSKVSTLKNVILDAEIETNLSDTYQFYLGGIYKNQSTYGNGFIVMRRNKSNGAVGGMFITTMGSGASNLDSASIEKLNMWANGGVQYTKLNPQNTAFGITKFNVSIDLNSLPDGYLQLGYQDNDNWNGNDFHPSVYKKPIVIPPAIEQIKSFNTFKEALVANQTGLIKVGGILSESKVNPVTFSGNGSAYFPSQISDQYRVVNNRNMQPKISREIMSIELEYSTPTPPVIKGYGEKYIYFGTPAYLYRTQFGLNNRVNTYLNTKFERIKLPSIIPDSQYSENPIFNVFELGNGEILIELRNGVKENTEDDYRGHRMQLYLTDGFPELIPVENSNGVLEYDLTGIITKVTEYKAKTNTVYRTTYSIHGSKIAISPYGLGLTGMVHLSNDYGKTWKVIFNMGVMGSEFAVPYKGSQGAWPIPENLIPPMPSDMWTVGGNSNFHTHGVIIDPYRNNRIWVCTGDAGENANGRSAIFFTDNDGVDWTRITEKGAGLFDDYFGMQAMGFVVTENMILFGTDSGNDGFKRAIFKDKNSPINIEAAYWCNGTYRTALDRIFGGSVEVSNGGIYSVFFPNTPTSYKKGLVVYTPDGIDFKNIYYDEVNDESGTGDININWGSFMFKDRFDNVYLSNPNGSIIKFY